ncbi:MAG: hypothetical protein Q9191_002171 [Dirinaria sp. TL-2023a]
MDFSLLMQFMSQHGKSWVDVYQPDEPLQGAEDSEAPLLVDIGGSTGAKATIFRRRYPLLPGRVICQDLPAVIDSAKEKSTDLTTLVRNAPPLFHPNPITTLNGIEAQPYNFFTPQPVLHARLYLMSSVLHDWQDGDARKILRNLVPAMKKGYSKLLLSENVIPRTACDPHLSALDLTMMAFYGTQERTEDHWRELLREEGLLITKIHTLPGSVKSVLEAELALDNPTKGEGTLGEVGMGENSVTSVPEVEVASGKPKKGEESLEEGGMGGTSVKSVPENEPALGNSKKGEKSLGEDEVGGDRLKIVLEVEPTLGSPERERNHLGEAEVSTTNLSS